MASDHPKRLEGHIDDKRSVSEVMRIESGEFIFSREILEQDEAAVFHEREETERGIQSGKPRYVCAICQTPVKIAAPSSDFVICHFRHVHNDSTCPWATDHNRPTAREILQMKYQGIAESERHKLMKRKITDHLRREFGNDNVRTEKHAISGDGSWKQPDILVRFPDGKRLAIELQLSTTFISVIVSRHDFYRKEGIFLVWVFDHYNGDTSSLNTAEKDVFYLHNRNVFVFDRMMDEESSAAGELRLNSYASICDTSGDKPRMARYQRTIGVRDLIFNEKMTMAYIIDVELELRKLSSQKESHYKDRTIFGLIESIENHDRALRERTPHWRRHKKEIVEYLGIQSLNHHQWYAIRCLLSIYAGRSLSGPQENLWDCCWSFLNRGDCVLYFGLILESMKCWRSGELRRMDKDKGGQLMSRSMAIREIIKNNNLPMLEESDIAIYSSLHEIFPELVDNWGNVITGHPRGNRPSDYE